MAIHASDRQDIWFEINSLLDERRDPEKATEAACKYFEDMYAIYGDWNLVLASYNCGPGNVNKAIRRSGERPIFGRSSATCLVKPVRMYRCLSQPIIS